MVGGASISTKNEINAEVGGMGRVFAKQEALLFETILFILKVRGFLKEYENDEKPNRLSKENLLNPKVEWKP